MNDDTKLGGYRLIEVRNCEIEVLNEEFGAFLQDSVLFKART